jgi:ribosomal protein S18 acetylase RimI-like enzyme
MEVKINNAATIYDLEWDTQFFGVSCAKAILHRSLDVSEWKQLKETFLKYDFISIENTNSEPVNAQFIGMHTNAFLADVNIQFVKENLEEREIDECIAINKEMKEESQILELVNFTYSKFIEDPKLKVRNGTDVYKHWILNSFQKPEKHFAVYRNETGSIDGFLLHSFEGDSCIIELIAVRTRSSKSGIGSKLFFSVESSAMKRGVNNICVGTQIRNRSAINFYHKNNCKQIGCHQVYHLWRQKSEKDSNCFDCE